MNTENVEGNVNEVSEQVDNVVHADVNAVTEAATEAAGAVAQATVTAKVPKVKGAPGRPRVAGSALSVARDLYKPNSQRSENVNAFIAAGIAKPIANTYFHLIQKEFNKRNPT